ncbi:MAG: dihydropteroate synthase [Kangiellaceae bacterium]|jgi:dihydropteroate synthase|nr:dihydropteroate synthase [Kangiellaceae bacterium]
MSENSKSEISFNQPQIMGILNVTPDSFSDGGQFTQVDIAVRHAEQMVANGADIIDVGGESTRPGAKPVTAHEEIARVVPIIEAIKPIAPQISIDTSKPEVMLAAVHAGATMINDVRALTLDGALQAAAKLDVPVCLMHMQGSPQTMQNAPSYHNPVLEVMAYLAQRVQICEHNGIRRDNLLIDPGFGFGKSLEHNIELLKNLQQFQQMKLPVLVGLSRKSMLGQITGKEVDDRLAGSIAVALISALKHAQILRVHDVAETVDAIKIAAAVY